ncbi:hypothetical protein A6A08_09215 [Nocardiopsis sp. TSRI0078]|uniref:hypothetical protein n=1 Tax=unclassified Nocardiopsis TaxID=2649073 RepID=UPI000939E03C|nr:hypothetical protein [Nocardiopsis sp. TSRI0078]OKI15736.1 hypothetical protein A6A08_09215 [Nocardiopsis sp. TSRI0078]
MKNPIPSPRRSDDVRPMPRPLPRRTPLVGPVCPVCDHPSCRLRRAQRLPRLGGHRAEFAVEHAQAAAIQARHRHLIVYYGEATQSFWAITPTGMVEARDVDALLLVLWPHTTPHTDPPAARPWARTVGGARVPAMA